MINILDKYNEAAEYLKEELVINDINIMKEAITDKKFLLSFVGQFSAGKSKLINNIIGQDVLPVHISETTQVVTFIKYAPISYGTIFYKDLTEKEVTLEEVKEIWQGKTNSSNDTKEIKCIEVFIDSELLKSGLMIADTPGVNTVIREHEDITNNVLKSSDEILYVISKPLTEVDYNFIRQILKMGLKVSCVRTFMDKIKIAEEDPKEAVIQDKENISAIFNESNINIYHVSNEIGNEWYANIEDIKKYILEDLAQNVEVNIEKSCKLRLEVISKILLESINGKKSSLERLLDGDIEKFNNEKLEIEKVVSNLKVKLDNKKKSLNNEIKRVEGIAVSDLKEARERIIEIGKRDINDVSYDNKSQEYIKEIAFNLFNEAYVRLQNSYIEPFNNIIDEDNNLIKEEMSKINLDNILNINDSMCKCIDEVAVTIEDDGFEAEEIRRKMIKLADNIEQRESLLKDCAMKKEDGKKEMDEINEIVKAVEREIANFGGYECRYIENENTGVQPSQVLRNIGNALDWATLLIPSKAYVKIAGQVGKYSKVAGKAVKAYKNVDKVKDMGYVINEIVKKTRVTKKTTEKVINNAKNAKIVAEKVGVLDYITFQYWFEKVGTAFDKPIQLDVDKEYEREYNSNKAMLTEKYNKAKLAEVERLQSLGLISSEEQKIKKMQEIDKRKSEELAQELKLKEREMRDRAVRLSFSNYKNQYIKWFENKINDLSRVVEVNCNNLIKDGVNQYSDKVISNINYEIIKWNNKNDELLNIFNESGVEKIKEEINLCNEYENYFKGEINV